MNELIIDTRNLTPIEIALQVDTDGRTTAKRSMNFWSQIKATIPDGAR